MIARLFPLHGICRPLWIGCLVLLALNDHWLKFAGLAPGWFTGKLSDVVGLVVAPAVLAGVLGLRNRRGLLGAHLAIGIGFAGINAWPTMAVMVEAATAWTPWPWVITCDWTDLLALPALLISWRYLVPAMGRPMAVSQTSGRLLLAAGALCCMATSEEQLVPDDWQPTFPQVTGRVVLVNDGNKPIVLRVRPIRSNVSLSCTATLSDPGATLSRKLFAAATTWTISGQRAVAFEDGIGALESSGCSAWLIDGGQLDPMVVFIDYANSTHKDIPSTAADVPAADGIRIKPVADGEGWAWTDHAMLFAPPPLNDPAPTPACAIAPAETGLSWAPELPVGQQTMQELIVSPDGCAGLVLDSAGGSTTWHVCAPVGALPFKNGDALTFIAIDTGHDGGKIDGVRIQSANATVSLARGLDLAPFGSGTFTATNRKGCTAIHDSCGGLTLPLSVTLPGAATAGADAVATGGESIHLGKSGTLYIVQARRPLVASPLCATADGAGKDNFQSAWTSVEDKP